MFGPKYRVIIIIIIICQRGKQKLIRTAPELLYTLLIFQWVPGLSRGLRGWGVVLTTHTHLSAEEMKQ